jgi:glycosyltransferase involved in cell wall biosynthesis
MENGKPVLIRVTTVAISLRLLLTGQMKFMSENGFKVYMVSSPDEHVPDLINEEQCEHFSAPMTRKITPLLDIISLIKLILLFRKLNPDIVHTHTPKAGILGMMAAWLLRVPIRMHTVAGLPWMESYGLKRKVLEITEKWTYFFATNIYPNSKRLKDFIASKNWVSEKKLKTIGSGSSNGVNVRFFSVNNEISDKALQMRSGLGISESNFIFCFIGRLVSDKGVNELVEATDILSKQRQDFSLILVGKTEDDLDPLSPETMKTIGRNNAIFNVGFANDVRPYIDASNMVILPSYREGFPNVPLQAGAMGKPCIATDINGSNEIIRHRETGWLVPPKNTKKLAEAMNYCLENRLEVIEKGLAIQKRVQADFDQQKIWKELLKEYKSHLSLEVRS